MVFRPIIPSSARAFPLNLMNDFPGSCWLMSASVSGESFDPTAFNQRCIVLMLSVVVPVPEKTGTSCHCNQALLSVTSGTKSSFLLNRIRLLRRSPKHDVTVAPYSTPVQTAYRTARSRKFVSRRCTA